MRCRWLRRRWRSLFSSPRPSMMSGFPQQPHHSQRLDSPREGPKRSLPPGVRALRAINSRCCPRLALRRQRFRIICYQTSILTLTFFSYMCYHLTRKPISVVKNVLHQNCNSLTPPPNVPGNDTTWCEWAPFDGTDEDANALLGSLDSAFLFAYAGAMFVSGIIAERVNLRCFLSIGMILSGIFCYLFGIARTYNIHSMGYFIFVQVAAGIAQTTGWPGVVTVVGKWFGKGKRGLIFGIWNSHTSIGNILGSLIAARFVETDWALSFEVPGVIMCGCGFLIYLFMVDDPVDVGLPSPDQVVGSINTNRKDAYRYLEPSAVHESDNSDQSENDDDDETGVLIDQEHGACLRSHRLATSINSNEPITVGRRPSPTENTNLLNGASDSTKKAVGFIGALKIPGVIEFSLSLFFAKLVSYTFLYWLPLYIKNSTSLSPSMSADLSTLFDVGGIVGGILAGVICDWSGMPALTCVLMLLFAAPMMMVYEIFGTISFSMNIFLLIIVGLLVNGPYALITTAVSAELGTHSSLEGNSKALATVTAIIDGTGSIGAAIGPMLAAFVSSQGWAHVFYMLICCDIISLVLLLRLMIQEIIRRCATRNGPVE